MLDSQTNTVEYPQKKTRKIANPKRYLQTFSVSQTNRRRNTGHTKSKIDSAARTNTTTAATNGDLDADGDTNVMGATYSMALDADTTIKVGFQNKKDADDDSHSQFDASISRALGGGASVFLDLRNLSGDAATAGSAPAGFTAEGGADERRRDYECANAVRGKCKCPPSTARAGS